MKTCEMSCIKYLLIIFNTLFMILGIVIIATAAIDMGAIRELTGNPQMNGTETDGLLIAVGVLIILIAAFGCFGAWRESVKLLYLYIGCLILIILLELSVGIAAAAMRPELESKIKTELRQSFIKSKHDDDDSLHKDLWNKVQRNMECCGISGPNDYLADGRNKPVSAACCPPSYDIQEPVAEAERMKLLCVSNGEYFKEGCEERLLTSIHDSGVTVAVIGILFCFLEIAGIILAIWLVHAIKNDGKAVGTA